MGLINWENNDLDVSCVTDGVTSASLEESANLAITVTADVSCFPVKNPRGEPGSVITE